MDFLTLDIEGPEYQVERAENRRLYIFILIFTNFYIFQVLLTIPWDKVNIRAIAVETFYMLPQVR